MLNKQMSIVTVGVTREKNAIVQRPFVPNLNKNLDPFTSNGDLTIGVKNSRVGRKTPKQTKQMI